MGTRNKDTENFPVGSWLVAPQYRAHVHAYYNFARAADDIADDPRLEAEDKIERLDAMERELLGGPGDGVSKAMRISLEQTKVDPAHCTDLLIAFRRDATKLRYDDFPDLLDYCRYSANPVGRYLLDLHGEDRASWGPSDALCTALQILNHMQDCKADLLAMDRCYMPLDAFKAAGGEVDDLKADASTPAVRRVLARVAELTTPLVRDCQALPDFVKSPGLRRESAVICAIAEKLLELLKHNDPVAGRVQLSKWQFAAAGMTGLARTVLPKGWL